MHLLKTYPLAKAPKALVIIALCLFIFLRDVLKELFIFGQDLTASLIFVQGRDLLAKGIISASFGLALFISIYLCLSLLTGYKKLANILTTVTAALIIVPLLALPERANGRFGESILTLERRNEAITGAISLSLPAAPAGQQENWYLLLDGEDATILGGKLNLTINGQKISGPLIPAISALDDWHYLKQFSNGRAYLECSWIYDCMTEPSAISNLDLRQWFYIPVSAAFIDQARQRGGLNVSINHVVEEPTKLFGAALSKNSAIIPSRALYSWEKAFYGVENDSGLTDSRYDEKVPLRKSKWMIKSGKTVEDLDQFDLNLRLLRLTAPTLGAGQIEAAGSKDVCLPLSKQMIKEGPLTLLRATLTHAKDYKEQRHQGDIGARDAPT